MKRYHTLSETMNALRRKGYTEDFNLQQHRPEGRGDASLLPAGDFTVDQYFRFEGESNPSDSSILYAISSADKQVKGLLVNAYGIYSEPLTDELTKGLTLRKQRW